mmetsp:Transcript_21424/g.38485  ORF Transcript_21424/g.38485 Transcript_21424/m.38485 type:complete len:130 (-) Transcript_21424:26-415(-)
MRVLNVIVAAVLASTAVAFTPLKLPPTTSPRSSMRWVPLSSTGRPGDTGPMCGERNPMYKFFTEDAPWKQAAAAKRAAAAGGAVASKTKAAVVKEDEEGGGNIAGKIGKASFLTLPWVYMAGEFISKQM